MRKAAPSPGRASGRASGVVRFPLIGVLVVAALLLGVLCGLVPCSLAAARERARRTKCVSNLKQIAYACKLYSGDKVTPDMLSAELQRHVHEVKAVVTYVDSTDNLALIERATAYITSSEYAELFTKRFKGKDIQFIEYVFTLKKYGQYEMDKWYLRQIDEYVLEVVEDR